MSHHTFGQEESGETDAQDRRHRQAPDTPETTGVGDDAEGAKDAETSGQVSEAGGATLNTETSVGGADAVPDTHG